MKTTAFLLLGLIYLCSSSLSAQCGTVPRFQKTPVGESGISIYFPPSEEGFEESLSEDKSVVYTNSTFVCDNKYELGAVVVKFSEKIEGSHDELENLLISYLEFLKTQFEISESAGYGKGHTIEGHPDVVGVLDYWMTEENDQYKIKGWVNNESLAVLMVIGNNDNDPDDIFTISEMFLDGFRPKE